MFKETSKDVLAFIKNSPSCFHAVHEMKKILLDAGYEELRECETWSLKKGGKYFTTRNGSSIVAFHIGNTLEDYHFQITSSHSDSPTFKVKEVAELQGKGGYIQLNTEGYGGMLCSTWLDRPLSLAGRVLVKEGNTIQSKLVSFDKDLVLIPNVAIHMNRDVNNGMKYNNQVDMLPLFSAGECVKDDYYQLIADELHTEKENILGSDLYLYNRMEPTIWGAKEEFISSPKLDDLQCAYTSLKAMINGKMIKLLTYLYVLIMKKLVQVQNRVHVLHSYMIHCRESTIICLLRKKITIVLSQKALWYLVTMLMQFTQITLKNRC